MFTKATIEKPASQEVSLPKNIQLLSVTSFHLYKKNKKPGSSNHYVLKSFLMDTLTIGNSPEDSEHTACGTMPERSHGLWMWPLFVEEQITQEASS